MHTGYLTPIGRKKLSTSTPEKKRKGSHKLHFIPRIYHGQSWKEKKKKKVIKLASSTNGLASTRYSENLKSARKKRGGGFSPMHVWR